jgi:hypothetical protein
MHAPLLVTRQSCFAGPAGGAVLALALDQGAEVGLGQAQGAGEGGNGQRAGECPTSTPCRHGNLMNTAQSRQLHSRPTI